LAIPALELTVCDKPYITLTCTGLEVCSPSSGGGGLQGLVFCLTDLMVGSALGLSWDHKVSTMGNSDSGIGDTGGGLGGDNLTGM
jgi:hypothetical protein